MNKNTLAPLMVLCSALIVPVSASALCIKVSEANLRAGPGTNYEKSWEVFKYMPLKKIGQQGKWYQVEDVDGDTHWVYSRLATSAMQCAVVKVDKANVRTGPGTRYAKSGISPVEKYYAFKVIGSKGEWANVQDEVSNTGWIAKSLIWMQ